MPIAADNSLSVSQPSGEVVTDSSLDEAIAAMLLDSAGFTIHTPKATEVTDVILECEGLDI